MWGPSGAQHGGGHSPPWNRSRPQPLGRRAPDQSSGPWGAKVDLPVVAAQDATRVLEVAFLEVDESRPAADRVRRGVGDRREGVDDVPSPFGSCPFEDRADGLA